MNVKMCKLYRALLCPVRTCQFRGVTTKKKFQSFLSSHSEQDWMERIYWAQGEMQSAAMCNSVCPILVEPDAKFTEVQTHFRFGKVCKEAS